MLRTHAILLIALVSIPTESVHAQRNAFEAERKVGRLLRQAQRSYDNLELSRAQTAIDEAIKLIERFGVDSDNGRSLAALVYMQRGIIAYVQNQDTRSAQEDFERALEYDDQAELDPMVVTPSLKRVFGNARSNAVGRSRRSSRQYDDRGRSAYEERGRGGRRERRDDSYRDDFREGDTRRSDNRRRDRDGRRDDYREDDRRSYRDEDYRGDQDSRRGGRDDYRGRRDGRRASRRDDDSRGRDRVRRREKSLTHAAPRGARSGLALKLEVTVSESIYRDVGVVMLYFNTARTDVRQKIEMRPGRGNTFVARIPRDYMIGSQVRYYFQAEDRRDNPIASLGSASRPYLIQISGDTLGAPEIASGSSLDGSGYERYDDDGRTYFTLGAQMGGGVGWVKEFAKPVTQKGARLKKPGLAPAPFHTLVSADFWVSRDFSVGGFARIQIVEFAFLGGGRFQYRMSDSGAHGTRLRVGGGVGHVRHLVKLGNRLDTTLEGIGHVSLGMTYSYDFNDTLAFTLSPDYLHMFGASPSYHLDVSFGLELNF